VSRVRVTPELVDVRPGRVPQTRWSQSFDAALTGVFEVEADIAAQVAQALDVALADSTRRELAARPTRSVPAYDAYLRGQAEIQKRSMAGTRQAVTELEQAVAHDSNFVEAWAVLTAAHSVLYINTSPTPARAESARRAAERAVSLGPRNPSAHRALGGYYKAVLHDLPRGYTEDSIALALAPGDASLLAEMGKDEMDLGRPERARVYLEQSLRLNPRSHGAAVELGRLWYFTRRYGEAERVYDHALRLMPENMGTREERALVAIAQGDLAGARRIIKAAPRQVDRATFVAILATYVDLMWILDDAQQLVLLQLSPSAFENDRVLWGMVFAQTYWLRGDRPKARIYADSARLAIEQQLKDTPEDAQRHAFLGLALAYLGLDSAAISQGERALAAAPMEKDPTTASYVQHQLVRIYMVVGEPEKALDLLEPLLKLPYDLTPSWLKIDPNFDPLRGNPRFERLVNGS
jgi:tetratricopeptide (TPR) repeat protein